MRWTLKSSRYEYRVRKLRKMLLEIQNARDAHEKALVGTAEYDVACDAWIEACDLSSGDICEILDVVFM